MKKNLSQNLFMVKALCAAYLCWKNVWENSDQYQCTTKKIRITIIIKDEYYPSTKTMQGQASTWFRKRYRVRNKCKVLV